MPLQTGWIRYGEDGQYSGYTARLDTSAGPQPAVIVLQEIWGVDEHIQDVARRFALAGYTAFAPDLFSRGGERPAALSSERIEEAKQFLNTVPPTVWRDVDARNAALDQLPAAQKQAVSESLGEIFGVQAKIVEFREQVKQTASFLRESHEWSAGRRVASVGFCLGGALSFNLAASDPQLAGAVVFYGANPGDEAAAQIVCPVLGFYGSLDGLTATVAPYAEKLSSAGKRYDYVVYEGAQHAFYNDTRPSFDIQASRDAYARTLDFLRHTLA